MKGGLQIPHPNQIVGGGRKSEDPSDTPHAAVLSFPLARDGLQPSEKLFHELALPLTDFVAGVLCGTSINGTAAGTVGVLRDMGCGALCARLPHEIFGVVGLVPSDSDPMRS